MQAGTIAIAGPTSVAIVGNAPDMGDQSAGIDAADWVVRFNNAAGFGGRAGRRVTHLALVNHGGQMREWLDDPGFVHRPFLRAAGSILFPFPPKPEPAEAQDAEGRDWTREARDRLKPLGATFAVLPPSVHRAAEAILRRPARSDGVPSTGFLVALHLLAILPPETRVGVHGFGFTGWDGHDWRAERQWFETLRDAGRLQLHALGARHEG